MLDRVHVLVEEEVSLRFVVGVRDGGRPSRSATGVLTIHVNVPSTRDGRGNASTVGQSASQSAAGVTLDGSVVAAIAAVAGCFVVTLVFSLLAVAVHRRAMTAATFRGGGGGGVAASRAAWIVEGRLEEGGDVGRQRHRLAALLGRRRQHRDGHREPRRQPARQDVSSLLRRTRHHTDAGIGARQLRRE